MAVNNAGQIVPDPGESRREMGRREDELRGHLDKVSTTVGDLSQAILGGRAAVEAIRSCAEDLGLDRSRAIAQAEFVLDNAERDLRTALRNSSVNGPGRKPASVAKADREADKLVDEMQADTPPVGKRAKSGE